MIPMGSSDLIACPICREPLAQIGKYWICPEHGQISREKPHAPLSIFLSYGHDDNEELVRRIKADLEKREHDVWFDKNEIKFGDDWRRSITEGITNSQRFVSFLSKHSTRDPGVCLDEIAIAIGAKGGNIQTVLVESEREVKPPPSISHIQWLDMHDWKERRVADEAAWEQWYQAKLAEIVAVVESDESRRFGGEIKTLEELLKPTVSGFAADSRIRKLLEKKLVGRTWLFEAVENWRTTAERDARLFWLMGAPGIGKSAFAAHLAHEYGRGTVIAVQFCDWKKPDHRDACRIIRTLAFQIATRLPDYRKLLLTLPIMTELDRKNSAELFDGLLTNPLKLSITGGRERYLIVIDALDEAGGDGRNELVEVLARYAGQLPDWIGLVVTSRPEFDVTTPFQALKPFPFETKSEANSDDIRAYLRRELAAQLRNRPDADRLVEQILEKSEGVFLYVESFCEDIRKHHLSLDRPNEFPQGLAGKFFMDFQRYFPDLEKFRKDVRPALRAILAAREPLPVEIIREAAAWPETIFTRLERPRTWKQDELHDFLRSLGSLFPIANNSGEQAVRPYHKALADWVTNSNKVGAYFVSGDDGNELLAWSCWDQFQRDVGKMSVYFLRYAVRHLRAAGRDEDAKIIWENKTFRQRRTEMGIFNIFLSYARGDDDTFVGRFSNDLKKAGFAVWSHSEMLIAQRSTFQQELKNAIRTEVDRVIYVGGPRAAVSPHVREEWQFALECDSVLITPILRVGNYDNLPGELSLLHCEDFRNDRNYEAVFAKLIAGLRQPTPDLADLFAVPSLPPHFRERPELMRRVRDALLVDLQKPTITEKVALVGMLGLGGIGKTVLAAALARNRQVRQSFPDGVVWIACGQGLTDEDLLKRQRDVARYLGGDNTFDSLSQGLETLRRLLANKAVLLVLDDVWRAANAEAFDVLGPRCRMLVTTRDNGVLEAMSGELVPVSLFTESEGLQMLADVTNVAPSTLPAEASEVVRQCGCLPLALAICGGMVTGGKSWHDILLRLREAAQKPVENTTASRTTLENSLDVVLARFSVQEQRRLAELCLALQDGVISEESVNELWSGTGNLSAEASHAFLIKCQTYALVRIEGQGQKCRIVVHQLVRDLLRHLNLAQ
jgi:hypothetical protein